MNINAFIQKELQEKEQKVQKIREACTASMKQLTYEFEGLKNDSSLPEKTNTLKKLIEANGKDVFVYTSTNPYLIENNEHKEERTILNYSDESILVGFISYPLIGEKGSGIKKIVDAQTNEVIFENPYTANTIAYQKGMLLGRERGLQEAQLQIDAVKHSIEFWQKDLERTKQAFEKVPSWIERGNKIIYKQLQEKWEDCVLHRASALYHGMDLENALQIMESLDSGSTIEAVTKLIDDGYSGASYGAMMSVILSFSKRGVEFCKANHSSYKYALKHNDSEELSQWAAIFAKIEAQNKALEAGKAIDGK